jgi:WD40 repeat protein
VGRWVAFSPDGATVAASSDDGVVRRWKVADGNILSTTEPPAAKMSGARVRLLSGEKGMAWGVKNSTVLVWEVPSGKLLSPGGGHTSAVRSLAVSADSKFVVTSSDDGTVLKWELETGKPAGTVMQPVTTAYSPGPVLSPDFTRALTRDYGSFALYDVATAKQQYVIPTPPEGFSTVTFTPDGSKVVVASPGNTFRKALAHVDVWDVRAGKRLLGVDLAGSGYAGAALTPDGKHLLTAVSKLTDKGPGDAVVTAWELAGGAKKGEATVEGGYTTPQVAPAADNKTVAVVTGTGKLVAVEFATGQVTKTFDLKQSLAGPSLFSPDGKLLAVTGSAAPFAEDRAAPVLVLDWPAGTVKHTFSAKHGMPNAMVFSPDGKYLVTGSNDGTATVWELGK